MKLIYTKDGFGKNEKEEWRVIIFNNILDGLRLIVDAMEEFGISFAYDNTTVCANCQNPPAWILHEDCLLIFSH